MKRNKHKHKRTVPTTPTAMIAKARLTREQSSITNGVGEDLTRECIYEIRKTNQKDNERKTYRASLSSEQTVDRWFGKERLIHDTDAIVLDRVGANGLPLLFNHNPDESIGKIRNIKIENNRLTGDIVFGNSERARVTEADINEKLLDGVSIGYRILKIEHDQENEIYNVTRWELLEASIAPVPADNSVGVGRNNSTNYQAIEKPRGFDNPDEAAPVDDKSSAKQSAKTSNAKRAITMDENETIDIQQIENKAREKEQRRIASITSFGEKFDKRELANEHIVKGTGVEDFRGILLDMINPEPKPLTQGSAEDSEIGMSEREIRQFSFCRALAYLSDPQSPRMQELAAFEIDCSRAAMDKSGKRTGGIEVPNAKDWFVVDKKTGKVTDENSRGFNGARNFTIPMDVLNRDLTAGTATAGAELVATNLLAGSFIDVLRNLLVVRQAGATMLTDLTGDISIPRKTSGSTGGWVAEGVAVAQSDMAFDSVTMSPKTAGMYTEYSRQLLLQSSLSVEQLVRTDLAVGLATTIDLAALYGTGAAGQPTGINSTSGINTVTAFAGANPTFAEAVTLETAVDVDNALLGTMAYIMRADMKGALKTTEKATNTAQFVYESDNTMNGYPVLVSQQVTSGDLWFGNWADLLIGTWGGLSLLVDPYTNGLSGTIRIVAHQSVDVAVRHPVSFAYGSM